MDKVVLNKPIKINGKEIIELDYDVDEITPENFIEADGRASSDLIGKGITNISIAEVNSSLHFYLGCFAIIACNSNIDIEDLKRVKGRDFNKIRRIGQTFFSDTVEEEDPEKTDSTQRQSDGSSEIIQESTAKSRKN